MKRLGFLGSNFGAFSKSFCAPNTHKFEEIKALATKIQAGNPSPDLLATTNSRNQPLSAVIGLWAGGGACCGDCTDGLDSDFAFLTGILSNLGNPTQSILTPQEENDILQQTLPLPEVEASFLARNAMPLLVGGSVLLLGTIGMILMIKI